MTLWYFKLVKEKRIDDDDDKIASKNFIVAALRLLTTNFSQEVTYSFVLKYYYYTILHTIECLKKIISFFSDADVFVGSLEACRKKKLLYKKPEQVKLSWKLQKKKLFTSVLLF